MRRPEFEWSNGDGPPHQRTFETTVTVGNLLCTGKGRSKKESRHKATEAMLNFFNKTLIYHWSHHKRGWFSFLLESLFRFYLRAPYREDGLSYFHEGQRNQEPVITALSSHNSNRKSIFCWKYSCSFNLGSHRHKLQYKSNAKKKMRSHLLEECIFSIVYTQQRAENLHRVKNNTHQSFLLS